MKKIALAFVLIFASLVSGTAIRSTSATIRTPVAASPPNAQVAESVMDNIPNALANPTLELHNGTGALIAANDDWRHTIIGGIITSNQRRNIQNSGYAPTDSRESTIIATLQPGNYTAIVRGVNETAGVALVEVYDLD